MAKKKLSDVDRRTRQSERLARHLRILECIMGRGRWDLDALAEEFGCTRKTIQRTLDTFRLLNIPVEYDKQGRAYRVRPGFRVLGINAAAPEPDATAMNEMRRMLRDLLQRSEQLTESLQRLMQLMDENPRKTRGSTP